MTLIEFLDKHFHDLGEGGVVVLAFALIGFMVWLLERNYAIRHRVEMEDCECCESPRAALAALAAKPTEETKP